jgi:hypothetical protein
MRKDRGIEDSGSSLIGMDSGPQPGDFPIGSIESRAAARAKLEHIESNPGEVIRVRIVHIAHDGKTPLPPPSRSEWPGRVTLIEHVASEGT